jgi:hypothetical protein
LELQPGCGIWAERASDFILLSSEPGHNYGRNDFDHLAFDLASPRREAFCVWLQVGIHSCEAREKGNEKSESESESESKRQRAASFRYFGK